MPYTLPRKVADSDQLVLVLVFGKLSVLEACTVLSGHVDRAESPTERVSVLTLKQRVPDLITDLAGVHKCAPLVEVIGDSSESPAKLVQSIAGHLEEKSNISISGYDISEDDYEQIARSVLDGVREEGFRKVRLLRPRGNELLAEQVLSRSAFDIVAFPYHGGFGLGPTAWVPDSTSMRQRGTQKPTPHSDISMSPRLARVLLNLAGLSEGQSVLDPFCGSGTILAEALIRNYRCLGLDSKASRVQDARENLGWLLGSPKNAGYDIRLGDSRELPKMLRRSKVDAIVTEPLLLPRIEARPKTSTASALIDGAGEVYGAALASMAEVLQPGGRIVIVAPVIETMDGEEVSLELDGRELGLRPHQPGPVGFQYPVRLSFESTRWVKRAVYVFESRS
ncbi:MAG: DNA methyltransferase [Thaumarchaeota archaeon]|nr:DNA methyltransferase [Nitrososphaerota archaeon]